MLPQRHPFRLVDRQEGDAVVVALSADATLLRGLDASLTLAVEILAQAALLLQSSAATGGGAPATGSAAFLGGVDEARLLLPLAPGDRLLAYSTVVGRLAGMIKLSTWLERRGERVAEASLLLVVPSAASSTRGAGT